MDCNQAFDSGREAVAITLRLVNVFKSCTAIEPTPPAAPITKITAFKFVDSCTFRRSNNISHAVIEVRGRAAASASVSVFGFKPTIRSSTNWNSA